MNAAVLEVSLICSIEQFVVFQEKVYQQQTNIFDKT